MQSEGDQTLGVRLTVAAVGAVALLMPFAFLAILVVGNVAWLHRLDLTVTDGLHGFALDHPVWVHVMAIWSNVFDPWVWRVASVVLIVWLVRRDRRALAWWVAITVITGGLLGVVLKLMVGRNRPDLLEPVARATGYAFPSGHALNNALGAAVFLLVLLPITRHRPRLRAGLWAAAIAVPLITAASRVVLGVHWTSDVVAGLVLGVAVVAATASAFLAGRGRRVMTADGLQA